MPEPRISIQPEREHTPQPAPSQKMQLTSTSAEGSVNGKKLGRKRTATRSEKSARRNVSRVALRWPKVIPSSTSSPSIWWNIGEWRRSESRR